MRGYTLSMLPDSQTRIFTIPSGTPFLDMLAETLLRDPSLGGRFRSASGQPPELADMTILLPTRRAVRALGEAFLRAGEGDALLLPAIRPLGDVDEEELVLGAGGAQESLAAPSAIAPMARQLRLARMILDGWKEGDADTCRALALAADLGRFLDMAITEGVDLGNLKTLVPDEFAANWQLTIEFLKLLTARWPEELARLHLTDAAARRNLLLAAQTAAWKTTPPRGPVIAAGSTGSIPATAALLDTVARLPQGAVVLPGLDLDLDGESWAELQPSHPQYGMKQLLARMRAGREDVITWPGCKSGSPRTRLLSEALRPAETTQRWRARLAVLATEADAALDGLSLIEAPTQRDEALAIALAMRETLETPGKTAALVTPDRALARRVAMELRRWNIAIDDSGGQPLSLTPPLTFLRLVAEAIVDDLAPVSLLACLKHPFAALGLEPRHLRARVRALEHALLRGPRPTPGMAGLRAALSDVRHKQEEGGRRGKDVLGGLDDLIDRLEKALAPFLALMTENTVALDTLLHAHISCTEHMAATMDKEGAARLWSGEAGEAAADFMRDLLDAAPGLGHVEPRAYPALLAMLAAPRVLRPHFGRHPRLFIWGPLEARLQHADRIILGGLNEGTWPAEANIDPWLNRPMRAALGLEPPERRIGLAAHDFAAGACAPEAVLTRALKADGAPTVASRWLLRLHSLLKGLGRSGALAAPRWTGWAQDLDRPERIEPVKPPAPRPPRAARPLRFSVTEIETLIRDPYAIYARKILRLRALDPLDADVSAAERGTIIHEALEHFVKRYPEGLPDNAREELIRIGREVFAGAMDRPGVAAFWWPRFERIAHWIVEHEREYRTGLRRAHAEVKGEIAIEGLGRPLVLSAKADRVDEMKDGTLSIIDYKTGQLPTKAQTEAGLAPQLPLEAVIAAKGGFADMGPREASAFIYLRLTGGETAGEEVRLSADATLADKTHARLVTLLAQYEREDTPYLSRPRPMFEARFGDYDHLARVKEWSAAGGESE